MGNPAVDYSPIQEGVEIFLVTNSCYGNQLAIHCKHWPEGPWAQIQTFIYLTNLIVSNKQVQKLAWVNIIIFSILINLHNFPWLAYSLRRVASLRRAASIRRVFSRRWQQMDFHFFVKTNKIATATCSSLKLKCKTYVAIQGL